MHNQEFYLRHRVLMVLLVGILNYHIYQDFLYLQLQLILGVGWRMSPELELSRLQWCSGGSDSGGSGSGGSSGSGVDQEGVSILY